jgi:peptidoglycan hydrolase CwlO-like protein
MTNKATSLAENIMNGSLKELHDELLDLAAQRANLEKKIDEYGLREKIHEIEEKQDNLTKEKDRKRRRMNDLKSNLKTINDEIVDIAADTQRNVRKLTNQNVKINIKE